MITVLFHLSSSLDFKNVSFGGLVSVARRGLVIPGASLIVSPKDSFLRPRPDKYYEKRRYFEYVNAVKHGRRKRAVGRGGDRPSL